MAIDIEVIHCMEQFAAGTIGAVIVIVRYAHNKNEKWKELHAKKHEKIDAILEKVTDKFDSKFEEMRKENAAAFKELGDKISSQNLNTPDIRNLISAHSVNASVIADAVSSFVKHVQAINT